MKNEKIKRMTTMALLIALTVVLQLLGYFLPVRIGPFGLSFVLIPIIIGAAFYGPKAGAVLGGAFGVVVVICCINGLDAGGFMVWQANPWLCVLIVLGKGILAGLCAGLVHSLFRKKNGYLAMLLAAIVCPVINTGIFLAGMSLFYMDVLSAWAGGSNIAGYLLSGIVLINFVPELLINIVFSPAGHRIVKAAKKI